MMQSHPEGRGGSKKTKAAAVPVVLLSPFRAEGTVVFHQHLGQPGARGDFFPGKTKVSISEKIRCQMLLAKSRIVLNVTLFPPATNEVAHFPFEVAAWEPMDLPTAK